jgi:phage recombination protein Bet
MTAPIQTAPSPQTTAAVKPKKTEFEILLEKDVKSLSWIEPYGADEGYTIPLSVKLIRDYVAVPFWDRESKKHIEPPDEQCFKFIALCKARRLNPYEGDAYMIPFWDSQSNRPLWSLITSHNAFLKRAELHPKYDGMDSGIIVLDKDKNLVERVGDFDHPGDQVLGGWAVVYRTDQLHPKRSKVKLSTYKKNFGVWLKDEAGMICKVAEAHAVRDTFPSQVGGMLMREEVHEHDGSPITEKKPQFTHDGMDMLRKTNETVPTVVPAPEQKPEPKKRTRPTMVEEPMPEVVKPESTTAPVQPVQPEPAATVPAAEPAPAATAAPTPAPTAPAASAAPETDEQRVKRLAETLVQIGVTAGITVDEVNDYLVKFNWKKPDQKVIEIAERKLQAVINAWQATPELGAQLKKKLAEKRAGAA